MVKKNITNHYRRILVWNANKNNNNNALLPYMIHLVLKNHVTNRFLALSLK